MPFITHPPLMQLRMAFMVDPLVAISVLVLWALAANACVSYVTFWSGALPINVALAFVAAQYAILSAPYMSDQADAVPIELLQRWAWSHSGAVSVRAARRRLVQNEALVASSVDQEPVFTLELAAKCLVWSWLLYDLPDGAPSRQQAAADAAGSSEGADAAVQGMAQAALGDADTAAELAFAMRLFGLQHRRQFLDRSRQTKVVVAWSAQAIVIAARGTAHAANAWDDAKVRCQPAGTACTACTARARSASSLL